MTETGCISTPRKIAAWDTSPTEGRVVWGVPVRIALCQAMFWLTAHLTHRHGPRGWVVDGMAVQGHDLPAVALLTFGEAWHGNHHAWPGSARFGLEPGQWDPGWWILLAMRRLGLVWDSKTAGRSAAARWAKKSIARATAARPGRLKHDRIGGWRCLAIDVHYRLPLARLTICAWRPTRPRRHPWKWAPSGRTTVRRLVTPCAA